MSKINRSGESWPYHENKHGDMVPCVSNPCRLHGGSEIIASSAEEAYELKYDNNDDVKHAILGRDRKSIESLNNRISAAVRNGGYFSISSMDADGNMIGGSLPVIGMNVPEDKNIPVTFEVDSSFGGRYSRMLSRVFHDGDSGAQVSEEPASAMKNMRMFVTPDGLSGAALAKDGCNDDKDDPDYVTAVCKDKTCTWRHSASGTVGNAISNGGRRLDCFDTFLPKIYGSLGFKPVARIPFNTEYAPETWDYDIMKPYHDGCPDVVFMSIQPSSEPVKNIEDYDEALHYAYDCSHRKKSFA